MPVKLDGDAGDAYVEYGSGGKEEGKNTAFLSECGEEGRKNKNRFCSKTKGKARQWLRLKSATSNLATVRGGYLKATKLCLTKETTRKTRCNSMTRNPLPRR